jgi:CDP-glycerol glycerophosphotransferase
MSRAMTPPGLSRLRAQLRGRASRTLGWAREQRTLRRVLRPEVSVIVPFYDVEEYFEECLESIAGQNFRNFEAILVDDDSPDGCLAIAERFAARDPRFRVVRRPNGGLGAARNTGIRVARGKYLTFVDSDDALPVGALWALVSSARRTRSQIVVGSVRRFDRTRAWRPSWVNRVHFEARSAITLPEFPALLRNLYTWNKLFDRRFFLAQGLWFREGVAYEDQPIISQLYNRASSIDLLTEVVYHYRNREDRTSISQQTWTMSDLRARIDAFRLTRDALLAEAPPEIYDAWLQTLFDSHLHWYLKSRGTADDEFWKTIREVVLEFTDGAPQELWDRTPPIYRVMLELTRQDRRDELREMARIEKEPRDNAKSEVRPDGILVQLPGYDDPTLPAELFVQRPEQLVLLHQLESLRWLGHEGGRDGAATTARLTGWAYIKRVDLAEHSQAVSLVLRSRRTGREEVFASSAQPEGLWPPPYDEPWCDYSPGTFSVDVPLDRLVDPAGGRDTWTLELRVEACGFTVSGPVTTLVRGGDLGALSAALLADGTRVVPQWSLFEPVRLGVLPRRVEVTDVRLDGRIVTGSLVGPAAAEIARVEVGTGVDAVTSRVRDGAFRLELPRATGPAPGEVHTWHVTGRYLDNRMADLVLVDVPTDRDQDGLALTVDARHLLAVDEAHPAALATSVEVVDDTVRVRGRLQGSAATTVRLTTRNKKMRAGGPEVPVGDDRFVAELPLRHPVFRFGELPLPHGEHDLEVELRTGSGDLVAVPLRIDASLARALPVAVDTEAHEGRLVRGPDDALRLHLLRPIRDARGRYRQNQLQRATPPAGLTRGILFRSYFGEKATDNGISIQAELRRRGSDLPVYWAVHDHAVVLPEGGIPVVVNTPEWYRLINSVSYYVDNMYQPTYHQKPEGQVLVETFHGYPFKQMGHPHWENLGFSPQRIDSYDERARQWDHLLSPARYATPLLTRDFAYDGPVLEIGYPRNDVLSSGEAPAIRAATRESLGIADHQTAVLYAPTFRDYLSADDMRAPMVDFLDFAAAREALGEDVVFLVRGHAFNARTRERRTFDGTIDVTDYPEVSDLYLAADVGVVDYSSLRFDFGVTGKPMIFLVPDLERYQETRGWLFDFEPTAPGPFARTTADVVAALADLAAVREQYAAAYSAFRDDYLDLEDGHAGQRFVDRVIAPRGDA